MRTANRNIDYLKSFAELILCQNKISYTGDDLSNIVTKYAGDRKSIDDYFDRFTIAFGKHLVRLMNESPRTLEHSVEDILKDYRLELAQTKDEFQVDYSEVKESVYSNETTHAPGSCPL